MNKLLNKLLNKLFKKQTPTISHWVINPPSWLERQVQNQMIDKQYEDSIRAEADNQEPSWIDKYN
tara:strand:- start:53 stop:247 length:195 start_codon:yes stop_codon:yes gene_type:complete